MKNLVPAFILAAATAGLSAAPLAANTARNATGDAALSSKSLATGDNTQAIRTLERSLRQSPRDAGVLINLGIAYARSGQDDAARALFERAAQNVDAIKLETASGGVIDSRRLAKKALTMLEKGEFAPNPAAGERLTRRD